MKQKTKFKETEVGKIPEDWKIGQLGNLCDITSSKRIFLKEYVSEGVPFYRSKEIILLSKNQIITDSLFISKKRFKEISDKFGSPKEGDLLMTSVGTLGVPYIVKKNEVFYFKDGNLMWFRLFKSNLKNNFLYYWIKSSNGQQQLDSVSIGSTQKALTIDSLKRIKLPCPNIDEQCSITKILSDLDSKIELNQKLNKILETIGQAIFKHWFIDFEFPNDEGKPYKSTGGEMVYNEELDKEIPKGWEIGRLSRIADITMGTSPPGDTYNEIGEGLPFFQGRRDFGFRYPYSRVFCTAPKRIAEEDDILFTVRAPVGDLNLALCKCAIGRGVASIRGKNNTNSFVYYLLNATINEWKRFDSEGTVFGAVNKDDVNNFKIIIPEKDKIIKFNIFAKDIDMKIKANTIESQYLSDLRDSLLPRLMSGRIRAFTGGSSKHG